MAVGSVSFGNTTQTFQDLINKEQTYKKQDPAPSASSPIGEDKKSHKGVKIGVGLVVTALAITAGLVAGAKTGVFKFENIKNNNLVKTVYEKLNKPEGIKNLGKNVLGKMDEIGNKIAAWGADILDQAKKLVPEAKESIKDAAETAAETAADIAQDAVS